MNVRSEVSIAVALIGFCMLNYFYLIPTQVVAEGSSLVYPALVNTILLCFSIAYLAEGVRSWRVETRLKNKAAVSDGAAGNGIYWRPIAMLVVIGFWVLTMEWIGFLTSTFVFLIFSSRIFGSKSWRKTLIFSLVMPLVVYLIFRGLNSVLPEGPLEELIRSLLG